MSYNTSNYLTQGGASWTVGGSLTISSGATLTNAGTLTNSGTLSVPSGGTLSVASGGTLVNAGTITNSGTLNVPSGGTIAVASGGTLTSAGTTKFGGTANYTQFESDGTMVFVGDATVWDDLRITGAQFDFPGSADPNPVNYALAAGSLTVRLYEFAVDDYVTFVLQLPHGYKTGSNMYAHVHWTAGNRSTEEAGKDVRWALTYSASSINGVFPAGQTVNLDDTVDGADDKHLMTSQATISGSGLGISSMILFQLKRIAIGANDWAGTLTGQLPIFLEFDVHYEMDTLGSREQGTK